MNKDAHKYLKFFKASGPIIVPSVKFLEDKEFFFQTVMYATKLFPC